MELFLSVLDQVRYIVGSLIAILLLLFIPGAVGVIEQFEVLASLWAPILAALLPMTILVFGAAGLVTDLVVRRSRHE